MMTFKRMSYTNRLKWRVRAMWLLIMALLAYMVIAGETGGDSRVMSDQARMTSSLILFGGIAWAARKIVETKKLLRYPNLAKLQRLTETDERNRYIHDKSGGLVWDLTFIVLLLAVMHTGLFSMPAFYTTVTILCFTLLFKFSTWFYYSHK